jgi:hypothetical protein
VANLIDRTKTEPVIEYNLDLMSINLDVNVWEVDNVFGFLSHTKRINEANLDLPVIVSAEGWILDGWHRVCKAILNGHKEIKAVRFITNPEFDYFNNEEK